MAAGGTRKTKAILVWEEVMPTLVGFGTFAAFVYEYIQGHSLKNAPAGFLW